MIEYRTPRRSWLVVAVGIFFMLAGCSAPDLDDMAPHVSVREHSTAHFGRVFDVGDDETVLVDGEEFVLITPIPSLTSDGHLLLADSDERLFAEYFPNGQVRWRLLEDEVGARFSRPVRAYDLSDSTALLLELNEHAWIIDRRSGAILRRLTLGLIRVEDVASLTPSELLFSGIDPLNVGGPRIHVYDLDSNTIRRSFYNPGQNHPDDDLPLVAGAVRFARQDSVLAATFALVDSLFFYTVEGQRLGAVKLDLRRFRPASTVSSDVLGDATRRSQWLDSFETIAAVHWPHKDTIAVRYRSIRNAQPIWHVASFAPSGIRHFEVANAPRLVNNGIANGRWHFLTRDENGRVIWIYSTAVH